MLFVEVAAKAIVSNMENSHHCFVVVVTLRPTRGPDGKVPTSTSRGLAAPGAQNQEDIGIDMYTMEQ